MHPHFPFIYLTISILGSSTIFGLSLKYTLRFVPSKLEQLANIVKRINIENQNNNISANSIQVMDGYTPTIFFDFEDYINKICNDIVLLDEFSNQLRTLVSNKNWKR